jgi:UDP-sugar pyrophosphorylase
VLLRHLPAGYSPFPGNINQLVIKLSSYVHQLQATGQTY